MSTDYYKNLWTTTQGKGAQFFKTVNFNIPPYQYQENIFRAYLDGMILKQEIKSVLELGAGTGRMTKIMLEEFPDYEWYTIVEISKDNIQKMFKTLGNGKELPRNVYPISGNIIEYVDLPTKEMKYDLILASEVFMHIKPQDIEYLIKILGRIGKQIINIDWTFDPDPNAEWYFIHDYEKLYEKYGAQKITRVDMKRIQQSLFHYKFEGDVV